MRRAGGTLQRGTGTVVWHSPHPDYLSHVVVAIVAVVVDVVLGIHGSHRYSFPTMTYSELYILEYTNTEKCMHKNSDSIYTVN